MDDLISRQAAIDAVAKDLNRGTDPLTDLFIAGISETLRKVPTAQPKKGKWLERTAEKRKKGAWTKECACEFCGFKPWYERDIHTLSFCPNCGADLRGSGSVKERG